MRYATPRRNRFALACITHPPAQFILPLRRLRSYDEKKFKDCTINANPLLMGVVAIIIVYNANKNVSMLKKNAYLMLINLKTILIFAYKYFQIQTITLSIYESTDL